jgi:hypothetical protein
MASIGNRVKGGLPLVKTQAHNSTAGKKTGDTKHVFTSLADSERGKGHVVWQYHVRRGIPNTSVRTTLQRMSSLLLCVSMPRDL